MTKKQKLELTWIGKDERPKLEPRILIEDPEKSYHAKARREGDLFDNMLIHGDNLLALKALEQEYAGKVKCVFIDPPYNTGSAFNKYDDGIEHSLWLSLIRDRLEALKKLLTPLGSIWVTIDDNEAHYLKVLLDEVFGRKAFVANIVWQKRTSRENRAAIGSAHDHLLVYAPAGPQVWKDIRNRLVDDGSYSNPDGDPKGAWRSIPFSAQGYRPNQMYKIVTPTGDTLDPPSGRCWGATEPVFHRYLEEGRVYFPKGGKGRPRIKQYQGEESGLVPMTWWESSFAGDNQSAKRESMALFGDDPFDTPKPEKLLQLIVEIASNEGEWVLDSFAGSATTAAVAHKLQRRWIAIEMGDHCETHCLSRMKKVVDGEDSGGVTETVGWRGGGGFRYFRLAPSLLEQDSYGNWVIAKDYNPAMLAEAMCKHMGFTYAPSQDPEEYWRHGHSTETDFIFVTTASMTQGALAKLSEEVGPERTLLVCCKAFRGDVDKYENLTVVKIPQAVLSKCEWGRDDYSLNIANLPLAEDDDGEPAPPPKKRGRKKAADEPSLFGDDNGEG